MEFKTTLWRDFTIAEHFGIGAIKDTFNRVFNEWKDNAVYITELVIVTNWKLWDFYNVGNEKFAIVYDELYKKADDYAYNNLKGEDARYFFEMTD